MCLVSLCAQFCFGSKKILLHHCMKHRVQSSRRLRNYWAPEGLKSKGELNLGKKKIKSYAFHEGVSSISKVITSKNSSSYWSYLLQNSDPKIYDQVLVMHNKITLRP